MKGELFMQKTPEKKPTEKVDTRKWGPEFEAEQNIEGITLQDIEDAFKKIELSSFDYLNQIVLKIKDYVSPVNFSKESAAKVRNLLTKAWGEIQLINNKAKTEQKELKPYLNYFNSVDEWLTAQKF